MFSKIKLPQHAPARAVFLTCKRMEKIHLQKGNIIGWPLADFSVQVLSAEGLHLELYGTALYAFIRQKSRCVIEGYKALEISVFKMYFPSKLHRKTLEVRRFHLAHVGRSRLQSHGAGQIVRELKQSHIVRALEWKRVSLQAKAK